MACSACGAWLVAFMAIVVAGSLHFPRRLYQGEHGHRQVGASSSSSSVITPQCSALGTCRTTIQNAIDGCTTTKGKDQICDVALGAGVFDIRTNERETVFSVVGVTNIRLHGSATGTTTLRFSNVSTFFGVGGSHGVTFENIVLDMSRVPFTAGRIAAVTAKTVSVEIQDQPLFPIDPATQAAYPYLGWAQAVLGYEPALTRFCAPDIYLIDNDAWRIMYNATSSMMSFACGWFPDCRSEFQVGSHLVLRHQVYSFNGFSVGQSTNLLWRNVTMFAAGGMGIFTDQCANVTLDGFRVVRAPLDFYSKYHDEASPSLTSAGVRPMSICADGTHFCNNRGFVHVTHSILEGQGDDGMNVNTPFVRITNASTAGTTTLLEVMSRSAGGAGNYQVGDRVRLFDGRTLVELDNELLLGITAPLLVTAITSASSIVVSPAIDLSNASVRDAVMYAVAANANGVATFTLVEHSTFRNNRARGVLMKQPNAVIRNCTFEGMTSPAVLSQVDGCFWMEGLPIHNWTVEDSTIVNVDPWGPFNWIQVQAQVAVFDPTTGQPTTTCVPASVPGVFQDVSILNNRFLMKASGVALPAASAAAVFATNGVRVANCTTIVGADARVESPLNFAFTNCTDVVENGNACSVGGKEESCSVGGL